jgi:hypothetical protein
MITTLPPAPQRSDSVNFAAKADLFLSALPTFGEEANTLAEGVNAKASEAAQDANEAAQSAQTALTAANTALGATAFKGPWSTLTGALNVPATVFHLGQYWILQQNLPNVAAVQPGTDLTKWVPLVAGAAPSVVITTDATAVPGIRYLMASANITLTFPAVLQKGDYFGVIDLVGDRTCKINFNGHKFRGRAAGLVTFNVPFSAINATYEDTMRGLV